MSEIEDLKKEVQHLKNQLNPPPRESRNKSAADLAARLLALVEGLGSRLARVLG